MRYFLVVSYDGSKFYGFQRQNDKKSVQNEIEYNLTKLFGEKIEIKGAGRTDKGVHAQGQCLHFDSKREINTRSLKNSLNHLLENIKVKKCKVVGDEFHSRFSVKKKHYKYTITFNSDEYNSDYMYFQKKLNIKKMKDASKLFLGVHNFQNFVSGTRDDYTCIIYKIKFTYFHKHLTIHFYGKSFYRYMVRNLVGALVDVGKGKADNNSIINLLNCEKTDKMLSTAPAKGLTLVKIYY